MQWRFAEEESHCYDKIWDDLDWVGSCGIGFGSSGSAMVVCASQSLRLRSCVVIVFIGADVIGVEMESKREDHFSAQEGIGDAEGGVIVGEGGVGFGGLMEWGNVKVICAGC